MKKKKLINPNIDNQLLSENRTWASGSEDIPLENPTNQQWRKRLISTMYHFAEDPENLEIMQFVAKYKIQRSKLYRWADTYPDVKSAFEDMKLLIAGNRRVGTMKKGLDGQFAYRDMHCYDPEWLEVNKYHADLKKDEERQSHTFIIKSDKPVVISKEELNKEPQETKENS
jgi:hypothetical protein